MTPQKDTDDSEQATTIERLVGLELGDAIQFIDSEVGVIRALNTDYYNGEPFGDEEPGRSQVVSRDVRDVVQAIMPSLMRILFGGNRVVEYLPTGPEDIAQAEQVTDYMNDVVVQQDNAGFTQFHSAIKDALVRKVGVFKWWHEDKVVLTASQQTNMTEEDLLLLQADESVEKIEAVEASEAGIKPRLFDVTIHRRVTRGRARFAALPGEEFLIDRRATSPEDATLVAHRQMVTLSDLVAMGYDRDEITEHMGGSDDFSWNAERMARNPSTSVWGTDPASPEMKRIQYIEAYTYAQLSDSDDDPAQLVRACGIGGSSFKLLHWEPAPEIPFALICPDPEPHTVWGLCPADLVRDIQRIKSAILRGTLDSMTLSLYPRTEMVDGAVNIQDLLNSELGGIIRVNAPGMLREIRPTFVGADSLPMLAYMDQVREDRTKQSQASQGLDADALQSSTKAAVSATVTAAAAQIELIARIFAETGIKSLFKGLLRLVVAHPDKPRMVRLRNQWVEVDPRSWNAEMDVQVNVALGAGGPEEKLATLALVAAKQELILSTIGADNPIVSLKQYSHTLAEMLKLSGWKDPSLFFSDPTQGEPKPPAEPQLDPAAKALQEAQMADIQAKLTIESNKLAFEREKLAIEDARERYAIEVDAQVKIAVAEAANQVDINNAQVAADTAAMSAAHQADTARHAAEAQALTTAHQTEADTAARAHEAQMAALGQVAAVEAQPAPTTGGA